MTAENNCGTLNRARALAVERGLDPEKVVCDGCIDGSDCIYRDGEETVLPEDWLESVRLKEVEGETIVNKFYRRIEAYFNKNGKTPKTRGTS